MAKFEPIPYRIRIGVTGHRKLEDADTVVAVIQQELVRAIEGMLLEPSRQNSERIRGEGVTRLSFRILSPLAEGADRAVARAVLSFPDARLDVVLPLTLAEYMEDFQTVESKTEFKQLFDRCRQPISLGTCPIHGQHRSATLQDELRRDAYERVGRYVVDHCDVLIAVWDGEASRGRGGTAEIVKYAEEQKRPIIRVWQGSLTLWNADDNNGLEASALTAIDQFNRHGIEAGVLDSYLSSLEREYFLKPDKAADIPTSVREYVQETLFPCYVKASIVAKQCQKQFYRAGNFTYLFSAAAVGCAALGVLFASIGWLGFMAELILLLIMGSTLHVAQRKHSHQRWIEHRFLAERLRSGIFLAICGVDPKPMEVLPYMGHSQTVNDWTVRVFAEIWDRLPPLKGCSAGQCLILREYIREVWIGDQAKFHLAKGAREGRARRLLARCGELVLPLTILVAVGHIVLGSHLKFLPTEDFPFLERALGFFALVLPAVAASLAGTEAQREHLRLEKRSANMVPQLQSLGRQMGSVTDPVRFEALLQQVDEIVLRETQDWLMLMRYAEIKA